MDASQKTCMILNDTINNNKIHNNNEKYNIGNDN